MRPTTFFALIALFLAVFLLSSCAGTPSRSETFKSLGNDVAEISEKIAPPVEYTWHGVALCGNLLILEARGSDGNVVEWVGQEAWHAAIAAAEKYPESEVTVWNLEVIYPQLSALCGVSA